MKIIKTFSAKNKNCFCYKDVIAEFPDKDPSHLSKVLASMVCMGMLMKFYRDLYCIIPLSADPETYSPDSRLVARTAVVTERQRQPSRINIKGIEFHFIYHSYSRFFGYRETWITKQEQAFHC